MKDLPLEGLTEGLARFAACAFRSGPLPARARQMVRDALLDTVSVMIAGAREPSVAALSRHVARTFRDAPEAGVLLGLGGRTVAPAAALLNGVAAHALDYDDIAFKAHPSAVIVPALLAEGERLRLGGADLIRGYLVAYDVWGELHACESGSYHQHGWHPTGVLGGVAAVAGIGAMARDDAETIRNAMAIAAGRAAGLTANFGSMAKHLQLGAAAQVAVEAIALARDGVTGAADALEHHSGLLAAFSPSGAPDARLRHLDPAAPHWALAEPVDFKRYPVCYANHRVLDGVIALAAREGIAPEAVDCVTVALRAPQASILRNRAPRTALDARFSIEFAVAAALRRGRLGLAELTDGFVADPATQRLMARVHRTVAGVDAPAADTESFVLRLASGAEYASGPLPKAASHDDLPAKFRDCIAAGPGGIDADRLLQAITGLEGLRDLRGLSACATGAAAPSA